VLHEPQAKPPRRRSSLYQTYAIRFLIRGFGVQVPGGAPVLTWCFPTLSVLMRALVWPVVGQGMGSFTVLA
jgi:hypothetical protein